MVVAGPREICYHAVTMGLLFDKEYFEKLAGTRELQSRQRKYLWLRVPLWIIPWVVFYALWNVLLVLSDPYCASKAGIMRFPLLWILIVAALPVMGRIDYNLKTDRCLSPCGEAHAASPGKSIVIYMLVQILFLAGVSLFIKLLYFPEERVYQNGRAPVKETYRVPPDRAPWSTSSPVSCSLGLRIQAPSSTRANTSESRPLASNWRRRASGSSSTVAGV